MSESTVTINGVIYDKQTGMPIAKTASVIEVTSHKPHAAQHAHAVHHHTQKSQTLNRRYVRPKVQAAAKSAAPATSTPQQSAAVSIPVSQHKITRFAKPSVHAPAQRSQPTKPRHVSPAKTALDVSPAVHPMVQRVAAAAPVKPVPTIPKPSHIIKQEAIEKSLNESVPAKHRRHREKATKHPVKAKRTRALRFASAGMAVFLVAGYFTYLNMPNLSVRIAAAQAGIGATYPSYRPSGYSLSGPVAFNDGQVSMKFAMNGGNQNFTLTQVKSSWDPSAIQTNYVIPAAGAEYNVTQANGLTIYTYGNSAAWVNGNILYTIKGDATLSADQISRIATSM